MTEQQIDDVAVVDPDPPRPPSRLAVAGAVMGPLALAASLVLVFQWGYGESDDAQAQATQVQVVAAERDDAVADAKIIASKVVEICSKGGTPAAQLGAACKKSVEVVRKPPPAPVTPVAQPVAEGLTEARARSLIREELVSASLALNPAVVDQLARVAAGYVRPSAGPTGRPGSPGQPGSPGTPGAAGTPGRPGVPSSLEEARGLVRAALATVCGDDGAKCRQPGPAGAPGKDAPAVTDEQRASDLAAYCSRAGSPCKGPDPFPFVFVFEFDDRRITCRITEPGVAQQCETVVIAPPVEPTQPPVEPSPTETTTGG